MTTEEEPMNQRDGKHGERPIGNRHSRFLSSLDDTIVLIDALDEYALQVDDACADVVLASPGELSSGMLEHADHCLACWMRLVLREDNPLNANRDLLYQLGPFNELLEPCRDLALNSLKGWLDGGIDPPGRASKESMTSVTRTIGLQGDAFETERLHRGSRSGAKRRPPEFALFGFHVDLKEQKELIASCEKFLNDFEWPSAKPGVAATCGSNLEDRARPYLEKRPSLRITPYVFAFAPGDDLLFVQLRRDSVSAMTKALEAALRSARAGNLPKTTEGYRLSRAEGGMTRDYESDA